MTELEIKKEAEKIQQMYRDDPRSETFNAIPYGPIGTGKTTMLGTARRPLHVDSFDPGGTKVLLDKEGNYPPEVYCDTRWEVENPFQPRVIREWDEVFHHRKRIGYYDRLGTYAIDSATTWAQDIMYEVMKKAGRAGGVPFQQDWLPQMTIIENAMREMVSLPCDCVLICHDDSDKDESTGRMFVGIMITGKLKRRIPLIFDEIYYVHTKETSKGIEYQLLTRPTGLFQARTRLGKGGGLDTYEKPDFKHILRKVGLPTEDRPPLLGPNNKE
ncbi:hypothetical protein E3J38_04230 [candidate division TA06 bacterium]|uniref:Uncharacterized protein n=1 Tax=candidate division TA06 bacterium TaxID=2250710 RepID=A0A523XPM7_UNCT6|nr:MAG: hypothetical protein E3J38_04230 [candidate division TA06 bacterium]